MKIFRGSTLDGVSKSSGDAVPFYHEGKYHVFFLTPPYGTTTYPDRLRITWRHLCSDNLVDWEELPPRAHTRRWLRGRQGRLLDRLSHFR